MAYRRANLDPRNASRTPSARTEIPARLRYDNPVNACMCFLIFEHCQIGNHFYFFVVLFI